ncbi:WXG100 family type VII secretion target [Micromonospora sp. NPDC048905]|uniref:WXG100 family type VII secretion target n=1 Tax=Micromonospora sp. NPDC048905 TaxID=3155494 RepID=UPI0033EAD9C2
MTNLSYDLGAMENTRAQLASVAGRIDGKLAVLRTELDRIDWSGPDQVAFQEQRARWEHAAESLREVLRDLAGALTDAAEQYSEMEAKNTDLWS